MSASAVRAGKAFVEITANDTDFQRGMKRVQHSVVRLGNMMRQVGSGMAIAGGAMGLPMVMAARSAATFEDALLELQGAAGDLSGGDLKRVREEALRLSRAMGVSPANIAQAFTLLVKAGMPLEEALSGGAKAAVEFARVGGVEAAAAAEFMADSINVFGKTAAETVDTLSAAADASSTSIAQMLEGFGQVAGFAKQNGQSLFGVAQALAVLSGFGMKGSEATTGLKTVLMHLLAPTRQAHDALAVLGLTVEDLVDKTGKMLPFAQLAEVFEKKMAGMSGEAREAMMSNQALVDVFGAYGIRVISAFTEAGAEGFADMATKMETSRTVTEKFRIAMGGISGSFSVLYSAVERLSIAFATGLGPSLSTAAWFAAGFIDRVAWILETVPFIAPILGGMSTALFGLGMMALFTSGFLAAMNFSLKNIINFKTTFVAAVRAMTSVVGNMSKAMVLLNAQLLLLRTRIYAIPVWGWALAGLAVVGGAVAYAFSGSKAKAKPKGSGIKRDEAREALGGADAAAMAAAGPKARGDTIATFSASIAAQLGIGPALTAQEQTADNTGRMADGVDALVRQGQAKVPGAVLQRGGDAAAERARKQVPGAAALQAGMAPPGVRGGVAARSDRDLVSMSERAAIAAEESRGYLRQLVEKAKNGGLAFA